MCGKGSDGASHKLLLFQHQNCVHYMTTDIPMLNH